MCEYCNEDVRPLANLEYDKYHINLNVKHLFFSIADKEIIAGATVFLDFEYCPKCGRKLEES